MGNGGQHEAAEPLASGQGHGGAGLGHPGPFLLNTKLSGGEWAPSSEGEVVQEALQEQASAAPGVREAALPQ